MAYRPFLQILVTDPGGFLSIPVDSCPFLWIPSHSCGFLFIPADSGRNEWKSEKY